VLVAANGDIGPPLQIRAWKPENLGPPAARSLKAPIRTCDLRLPTDRAHDLVGDHIRYSPAVRSHARNRLIGAFDLAGAVTQIGLYGVRRTRTELQTIGLRCVSGAIGLTEGAK